MAEALLVVACGLSTYLWRGLGVLLSGRINTASPVFSWVACVAYAMIAGLTVRLVIMPGGTLAQAALADRLIACGVAFVVYFALTRRNLFFGIGSGFVAVVALTALRTAA
jgi:branched-subunit amino acid transport protein